MPKFTPEAKLPVYTNFMDNPSVQTAAEVIKWEDEHIWRIRNSANYRTQALAQFGDEIRPNNGTNRAGYNDMGAKYSQFREKVEMQVLLKLAEGGKAYTYDVYFGDNDPENILMASEILSYIRKFEPFGKPPVTLFFNNKKSMENFKTITSSLKRKSFETKEPINYKLISSEDYNALNFKTSPSLVVYDKKNKKMQVVSAGQTNKDKMTTSIKRYLMTEGVLKESLYSDDKIIKAFPEFSKEKANSKYSFTREERKKIQGVLDDK